MTEQQSNYFKNAELRTQPFLITLFQAIMAFKKMAKAMRVKLDAGKKKSYRRGVSIIKPFVANSEDERVAIKYGNHSSFMADVRQPKKLVVLYEEDEPQHINSPTKATKRLESTIQRAARKIVEFNQSTLLGKNGSVADRIIQKLKVKKSEKPQVVKTQRHDSSDSIVSEDIAALVAKNFSLNVSKQERDASRFVNFQKLSNENEVIDYIPGTAIYFGATIALQARHGGYMSYNDPNNLKASAHKIMQQTRFLILNSDDLTDIGHLRYGDAVWLQAGQYEVLGAHYSGGPIVAEETRKIHPGLINCRRQNMFKAQQYGRWIVLNRDNPVGTIGQQVLHHDKVILEQEWYFLASSSPYESSMFRTKCDIDEAMSTGKARSDLFRPGDECVWKIHLVNLPRDDLSNERERQRLAQAANEKVENSKVHRIQKTRNILSMTYEMVSAANNDLTFAQTKLKHKLSKESSNIHLSRMYIGKMKSHWEPANRAVENLESVYGSNSQIVQDRLAVMRLKGEVTKFKETKYTIEKFKSRIEKEHDRYWTTAEDTLIDVNAIAEMPSVLSKYYEMDLEKKIKAARVLQRVVRNFLAKRFNYARSIRAIDKTIDTKIKSTIREKRKVIMDQMITMNSLMGKQMSEDEMVKIVAIDELNLFNKLNKTSDDPNNSEVSIAIAHNKRAKNMLVVLNNHWKYINRPNPRSAEATAEAAATESIKAGGNTESIVPKKLVTSQSADAIISDANDRHKKNSIVEKENQPVGLSKSYSEVMTRPEKLNEQVTSNVHTISQTVVSTTPLLSASIDHLPLKKNRPQSSNITLRSPQYQESRLGVSIDRKYGLPSDVFVNEAPKVNLKTGMKFLRAISKNPSIYEDVQVSSRRVRSAPSKR